MKLNKDALRQIRQFARERIGGFGMWIELREQVTYIGEVDNSSGNPDWRNVESFYSVNRLFKWNEVKTGEGSTDLNDFVDWQSLKSIDIELIDGFAWLDFAVHDKEELKDHVHALVNANGMIVKLWRTWANENEITELISKEVAHA